MDDFDLSRDLSFPSCTSYDATSPSAWHDLPKIAKAATSIPDDSPGIVVVWLSTTLSVSMWTLIVTHVRW
jgi:hypothetical protein